MFIRAKNRIIDLSTVEIGETSWESLNEYIAFHQQQQVETIKQANTIEELCDVFVCFGNGSYQQYIRFSLKEVLQKKEWLKRSGYTCNIYGAIWTDKGLIYVAKMNEKGELELL